MDTIFEKILKGEIETKFIYEDDFCAAFYDINPQAPVHCLIIPKFKLINLKNVGIESSEALGKLMLAIPEVAKIVCPDQDFRIVINNGKDVGQTVFYLHLHLLAGRSFSWPPG